MRAGVGQPRDAPADGGAAVRGGHARRRAVRSVIEHSDCRLYCADEHSSSCDRTAALGSYHALHEMSGLSWSTGWSEKICRCFLLMGEFVRDARRYVLKRPRIELLARDVIAQCALLSEVRLSAAAFSHLSVPPTPYHVGRPFPRV